VTGVAGSNIPQAIFIARLKGILLRDDLLAMKIEG
jgi:hypothetical protein